MSGTAAASNYAARSDSRSLSGKDASSSSSSSNVGGSQTQGSTDHISGELMSLLLVKTCTTRHILGLCETVERCCPVINTQTLATCQAKLHHAILNQAMWLAAKRTGAWTMSQVSSSSITILRHYAACSDSCSLSGKGAFSSSQSGMWAAASFQGAQTMVQMSLSIFECCLFRVLRSVSQGCI